MLGPRGLITTNIWPSKIAILGPGDAAMASSRLLAIVMLGPRKIVTTTIWPSRIAMLGPTRHDNDHESAFSIAVLGLPMTTNARPCNSQLRVCFCKLVQLQIHTASTFLYLPLLWPFRILYGFGLVFFI